jgi:hypothetical protein
MESAVRFEEPICSPNPHFDRIVGVALSTHDVVQLAARALKDGQRPGGGLLETFGKTFVGVTGECDELHYVDQTLPTVAQRVYALDQLVCLAKAELAKLDPDGLIAARNIGYLDQVEARSNGKTLS